MADHDTHDHTGVPGVGGGGGALVFLEAHTASTSATLDFTTFISGTYDDYEFHFINIVAGSSGANMKMLMGTGGGPTYDTGTNYGSASNEGRAGGEASGGTESGAAFIGITRNNMTAAANLPGLNGTLRVLDPAGALHTPVIGKLYYTSADPFHIFADQIGVYMSTTAVTAVRFLMSSGNIASGTIRVYGIAKA